MFTQLLYQIKGYENHHNCDHYGKMNDLHRRGKG